MNRRDIKRIEKRKKEWDRTMLPVEKHLKWLKKMIKKAINWYWFSEAKSDGGKALHIIMWAIVTVGIIGWWRIAFGN